MIITQEGDTTGSKPGEVWALSRQFVDGIAEHGYVRLHQGFRALDGMSIPNFKTTPIVSARRIWPEATEVKGEGCG